MLHQPLEAEGKILEVERVRSPHRALILRLSRDDVRGAAELALPLEEVALGGRLEDHHCTVRVRRDHGREDVRVELAAVTVVSRRVRQVQQDVVARRVLAGGRVDMRRDARLGPRSVHERGGVPRFEVAIVRYRPLGGHRLGGVGCVVQEGEAAAERLGGEGHRHDLGDVGEETAPDPRGVVGGGVVALPEDGVGDGAEREARQGPVQGLPTAGGDGRRAGGRRVR